MLRYWDHPLADDRDYRSALVEAAAEVLRASAEGEKLFEDLKAQNVNFVAAMCYAESLTINSPSDVSATERDLRQQWLDKIQRVIPSCFCNPDMLE